MVDFDSLDPETRCLALVGQFLQKWAAMEEVMGNAIQLALELDYYQTAIITSNTQLKDKIHILSTLVSLLPFEKEKKEQFDKTLVKINSVSSKRNMMAHNGFSPSSDGKGVSFSVTKAKGTLSFPPTVWDVARFKTEYAEIDHLKAGVSELAVAIDHKQITKKMREAARALPAYLLASSGTVEPVGPYLQTTLPLLANFKKTLSKSA